VVLNAEGQLLEANRAACELFGCASKDEVGRLNLTHLGIEADALGELLHRARNNEVVRWDVELTSSAPRILDAGLVSVPHQDHDGVLYQWVAHDITERVRVEEARQKLVNMIVHDLRVPLGNVINSFDLVMTAWRDQDVTIPVEQVLSIGLRSANRMERLVNDILDAARLKAGERPLSIEDIDVAEMVAEAADTLAALVSRHHHTLSIDVAPELPAMTGDPDLLRRVLINLLSNAIKYTPNEGEITVKVWMEEDAFQFAVIDNGSGISKEDQIHIFELFFRGHIRRSRGVGIGLAFCKLAVEAHGGRIWLDSEVDKGSSFYFTVPAVLSGHNSAALEVGV
jgi:PAS domain S-box-containing protein